MISNVIVVMNVAVVMMLRIFYMTYNVFVVMGPALFYVFGVMSIGVVAATALALLIFLLQFYMGMASALHAFAGLPYFNSVLCVIVLLFCIWRLALGVRCAFALPALGAWSVHHLRGHGAALPQRALQCARGQGADHLLRLVDASRWPTPVDG